VQTIPDTAHAGVAVHAFAPGLPARLPAPSPGEVQIWYLRVREDEGVATFRLLDDAERHRAARFRFDRDRARFVAHHAFVRRVLARYLGSEPRAVPLRSGAGGKPELAMDAGIAFNSSRSDRLSIVAVARDPVGVDVERLRPVEGADALAESLFTAAERRLLSSRPSASRDTSFLELWTRKEAVVKAFGGGLSIPLHAFDVTCDEAALHDRSVGRLGSDGFVVERLEAPHGWVASVSVVGMCLAVRYMDAEDQLP
jgi:4'-phosphopantetheinyl transferase